MSNKRYYLNVKWLLILLMTILLVKIGSANETPPADTIRTISPKTKRMSLGVKVGLNMADLVGNGLSNAEDREYSISPRIGFCIGMFFNYSFGLFGIQPEILIIQKGINFKRTIFGTTYSGSNNITFLEIPVLAKLNIPMANNVKPNIFAGPTMDIEGGESIGGVPRNSIVEETLPNSIYFGLTFGAGTDFRITRIGKFTADVRYNMGLTNTDYLGNPDFLVISLMLRFTLK